MTGIGTDPIAGTISRPILVANPSVLCTGDIQDGPFRNVATAGAHEAAAGGVLVAVGGEAIPAAARGRLAQLLQLEGLRPPPLAETGGSAGTPDGELGQEDLVPKEGQQEDGDAGEARRGDLKSEPGGEELGEGPEENERKHQPWEHGGDPPRPPLDHAEYTHYPGNPRRPTESQLNSK